MELVVLLETTAAMVCRAHAMDLVLPPLEITAATLLESMFVGFVKIPTFLPMSAMTLLMVGILLMGVTKLGTTIANIAATAKMRLPSSRAM